MATTAGPGPSKAFEEKERTALQEFGAADRTAPSRGDKTATELFRLQQKLFDDLLRPTEAGKPSTAPLEVSYVWDTRPPDDWLALRAQPNARTGRTLEKMRNGTLLEVLERRDDGWWRVRDVKTDATGWVLSRQGDRTWIACCKRWVPPA